MERNEDISKPPKHLNKIAKAKWRELIAIFNTITNMDFIAFETLCINYAMSIELYNSMVAQSTDGSIAGYFSGRNSQTMGEYNAYNKCQTTYIRLLNEFGLTPKSRKNIKVESDIDYDDPMSNLLYGSTESEPYNYSARLCPSGKDTSSSGSSDDNS